MLREGTTIGGGGFGGSNNNLGEVKSPGDRTLGYKDQGNGMALRKNKGVRGLSISVICGGSKTMVGNRMVRRRDPRLGGHGACSCCSASRWASAARWRCPQAPVRGFNRRTTVAGGDPRGEDRWGARGFGGGEKEKNTLRQMAVTKLETSGHVNCFGIKKPSGLDSSIIWLGLLTTHSPPPPEEEPGPATWLRWSSAALRPARESETRCVAIGGQTPPGGTEGRGDSDVLAFGQSGGPGNHPGGSRGQKGGCTPFPFSVRKSRRQKRQHQQQHWRPQKEQTTRCGLQRTGIGGMFKEFEL